MNISKKSTSIIVSILALVMVATRGNHFATAISMSDASWAIFFLLGLYSGRKSLFVAFIALAAFIDYIAVAKLGVSNYCITPAYAFLVPAYISMWFAGRLFAKQYQPNTMPLMNFSKFAVVGTFLCEIISSGSFYILGGRFADVSISGFAERLIEYFPRDLLSTSMYLSMAALIYLAAVGMKHTSVFKSV